MYSVWRSQAIATSEAEPRVILWPESIDSGGAPLSAYSEGESSAALLAMSTSDPLPGTCQ